MTNNNEIPLDEWLAPSEEHATLYHGSSVDQSHPDFAFQLGRIGFRTVMFSEILTQSSGTFLTSNIEDAENYGDDIGAYKVRLTKTLKHPNSLYGFGSQAEKYAARAQLHDDLEYILAPVIEQEDGDGDIFYCVPSGGGVHEEEFDNFDDALSAIFPITAAVGNFVSTNVELDGDQIICWSILDNPEVAKRMRELGYEGVKVFEENDDAEYSWFIADPHLIKRADSETVNPGDLRVSNVGNIAESAPPLWHTPADRIQSFLNLKSDAIKCVGQTWHHTKENGEQLRVNRNSCDISFFKNGKLHAEDGPAIIKNDGTTAWALGGEVMTEEQFEQQKDNAFEDASDYKLRSYIAECLREAKEALDVGKERLDVENWLCLWSLSSSMQTIIFAHLAAEFPDEPQNQIDFDTVAHGPLLSRLPDSSPIKKPFQELELANRWALGWDGKKGVEFFRPPPENEWPSFFEKFEPIFNAVFEHFQYKIDNHGEPMVYRVETPRQTSDSLQLSS